MPKSRYDKTAKSVKEAFRGKDKEQKKKSGWGSFVSGVADTMKEMKGSRFSQKAKDRFKKK